MKWEPGHQSGTVEDRRGQSSSGGSRMSAGAIIPLFRLAASFGPKGILVLVIGMVVFYFVSGAPSQVADVSEPPSATPGADPAMAFVSFVFDDVQATWSTALGPRYQPTRMVVYTGGTNTGCGYGEAASGPFYCPTDQQVYIDLSFYADLARRYGAPGDFAQAYVIAHELGHHVQHLTGQDREARNAGAEGGSVRLELQADCYAGIWAKSTSERQLLDPGDLEEALVAASSIGDDHLQRQTQGTINPDSFTHGSAAQRKRWFRVG